LGSTSQASTTFQGNISRQIGNIRAVTLEGRVINADKIFGAASAAQESIEQTFRKIAHDAKLKADRKSYEPRAVPKFADAIAGTPSLETQIDLRE
jgi:hypothetical protein